MNHPLVQQVNGQISSNGHKQPANFTSSWIDPSANGHRQYSNFTANWIDPLDDATVALLTMALAKEDDCLRIRRLLAVGASAREVAHYFSIFVNRPIGKALGIGHSVATEPIGAAIIRIAEATVAHIPLSMPLPRRRLETYD